MLRPPTAVAYPQPPLHVVLPKGLPVPHPYLPLGPHPALPCVHMLVLAP